MQRPAGFRAEKQREVISIDEPNLIETNIQWFPGHMTKAKRKIEQSLRQVDAVAELIEDVYKRQWYDEAIPFNMAAELGTQKVITEHSTIGLVITTDGSISDIPREEYEEAETRVISELQAINKPFIVLLNCVEPASSEAQALAKEMQETYGVPVRCV